MHTFNNQAIPPPPLPPAQSSQNPYYVHYAQPCTLHTQPSYVQQQPQSFSSNCFQQHLPHSKSLDQYDGKMQISNGANHHRLSLDSHNYKLPPSAHHLSPSSNHQQQQISAPPYDFIDPAFNYHPYNQPNVRAPLPYNLSSNLGNHLSGHDYYQPTDNHYYQQPMMQLPTPVSEYYQPHPQQVNDNTHYK